MKKIIIVFFIICATTYTNAQTNASQQIIAVEELPNHWSPRTGLPDNTYFKDVNNILDSFVGVWIGTFIADDSSLPVTLELHIEEYTTQSTLKNISYDRLRIRHKIFSGVFVLEDTTTLPDDDPFVSYYGSFTNTLGRYRSLYNRVGPECGSGDLLLTINNDEETEILFNYSPGKSEIDWEVLCPDGVGAQRMPNDPVILTKQ